MAQQSSVNQNSFPLIVGGNPTIKEAETILQEATRNVPLVSGTLMARIAASGKWTPFTNSSLTATDGSNMPAGIYLGDDIAAATLVAGDTTGMILTGDALIDSSLLVYGKGPTGVLATITRDSVTVLATALLSMRIEDALALRRIVLVNTLAADNYEN